MVCRAALLSWVRDWSEPAAQNLGDWLTAARASPNEAEADRAADGLHRPAGFRDEFHRRRGDFHPRHLRIASGTGIAPNRLMMPLSVAALISGMLTLVGTAPTSSSTADNHEHGAGFSFFSFPRSALPSPPQASDTCSSPGAGSPTEPRAHPKRHRLSLQDWIGNTVWRDANSPADPCPGSLIGRSIGGLDLRKTSGASVVAIERPGRFRPVLAVTAKAELEEGDILLVDLFAPKGLGRIAANALRTRTVARLAPATSRTAPRNWAWRRSWWLGHRAHRQDGGGGPFRSQFGLTVIGLRRRRPDQPARGTDRAR